MRSTLAFTTLVVLLHCSTATALTDKYNITPAEHQACDADAANICVNAQSEDEVIACMKSQRRRLTPCVSLCVRSRAAQASLVGITFSVLAGAPNSTGASKQFCWSRSIATADQTMMRAVNGVLPSASELPCAECRDVV